MEVLAFFFFNLLDKIQISLIRSTNILKTERLGFLFQRISWISICQTFDSCFVSRSLCRVWRTLKYSIFGSKSKRKSQRLCSVSGTSKCSSVYFFRCSFLFYFFLSSPNVSEETMASASIFVAHVDVGKTKSLWNWFSSPFLPFLFGSSVGLFCSTLIRGLICSTSYS